jgi:hypothetical protein
MKQLTTKTLFVIQPQSVIDVITNSSSELFVFQGKEKEVIKDMIKRVYPDYLNEYEDLKCLNELNDSELTDYIDWIYSTWSNKLRLSKEFNIEPEILYSNFDEKDTDKYWYGELSNEGLELIKQQLDLDNTYLLYSINDNPDWDMQEELMCIGQRYHLG